MKLKSFIVVPIALFLYFCLFMACRGVVLFGDDCPEIVLIDQEKGDITAGFGESDESDDDVIYRGGGFTPGEDVEAWTGIEFCVPPGKTDLRVVIDTADQDSIPEHDINGALFSFTIPNSELKGENNIYTFPKEFPTIPGRQYVIYLAPYRDGVYCNDYRDISWGSNDPYPGGKGVVNVNGKWMVSDISIGTIDMKVKIHGRKKCPIPPPPPTPNPTCTPPEPNPTPTCTPNPQPTPVPVPEKLRVDYTNPFGGQTNVDGSELIRIEVGFNLLMDGGGFINTSAISMRNLNNWELITFHKVDVVGQKIYFYFNSNVVENGGITYEATIFKDRVRAANNEESTLEEDYVWKFRTSENPKPTPTPMLERLEVERTIPQNGETGVSTEIDRLTAFFNFNIDESVGPFSAELREVGGVQISLLYIRLIDNEVQFIFTKGSLNLDRTYQATILRNKIKGENGAKLESDYSWTFSTETTNPTPTPPLPPPTPTPTTTPTPQEKCEKVEIFHISTKDMEIAVGGKSEIIVTVECEEGFSLQGIPIHARVIRWDDKKEGEIFLNGLNNKYERQTVLTDDEGRARFSVEGLKNGWLKIKVKVKGSYGFFKDVVKVRVKK